MSAVKGKSKRQTARRNVMGNPHEELMLREDAGGGGPTDHSVQLTAQMQGQNVVVTGNGGFTFANKSGAHRLNFSLNDSTGLNVTFLSLDRQDNCSTCP